MLQSTYVQSHGREQEDEAAEFNSSDAPLSRHVTNSLRVLYTHVGLHILVKGLYIASIYQLSELVLRSILISTVFRPVWLHLVADIVVTALLAEGHMHWTHTTISSGTSSVRARLWTHDRQRWKKLVLPCVAHGSAVVLFDWVSSFSPNMNGASSSDVSRSLSAIAIFRTFFALLVRSFLLAPAAAWLTLVEASCLTQEQETLVYEQGKGRFARAGAIFARYEQRGSRQFRKGVSLHLCLWLLELHIKKCALQMVLEGLVSSVVHLVA